MPTREKDNKSLNSKQQFKIRYRLVGGLFRLDSVSLGMKTIMVQECILIAFEMLHAYKNSLHLVVLG